EILDRLIDQCARAKSFAVVLHADRLVELLATETEEQPGLACFRVEVAGCHLEISWEGGTRPHPIALPSPSRFATVSHSTVERKKARVLEDASPLVSTTLAAVPAAERNSPTRTRT